MLHVVLLLALSSPPAPRLPDGIVPAIVAVERPVTKAQAQTAYRREKALGDFQIRPCMIAEVNRILGRAAYKHADALDRKKAEEIFRVYSEFWCRRSGDWRAEGIAKRWNGGPAGKRKASTEGYWRKVKGGLR